MDFKEIDIENFIWNNMGKAGGLKDLASRGLCLQYHLAFRQFNIPGCGIPDIVFAEAIPRTMNEPPFLNITVCELKRGTITPQHAGQLARYMAFLSYNNDIIREASEIEAEVRIDGILIGSGIDRDALALCFQMHGDLSVYTFSVDLFQGLQFKAASFLSLNLNNAPAGDLSRLKSEHLLGHFRDPEEDADEEQDVCPGESEAVEPFNQPNF